MTRVLLVHGAFHGAWCWDRLIPELKGHGLEAEAVELPFTSPGDDLAATAEAIDRLSEDGQPVMAVGHSFGGAIITAAAGGDDGHRPASHLVYLTAIMHDPGDTVDLGQTPGMAAIQSTPDQVFIDPAQATVAFYHRCRPEDAAWATARLRSMPVPTLTTQASNRVAWRTRPSTYIVCSDDQIISPDRQRVMGAQAGSMVEIDSDHSPFLSCPAQLAGVLAAIASSG